MVNPPSESLRSNEDRIRILAQAVGLTLEEFYRIAEWALAERLVAGLLQDLEDGFFARKDGLAQFKRLLREKTGREWSSADLNSLADRVRQDSKQHFRASIRTEDLIQLALSSPLRCAQCGAAPPEVSLEIDHIVPAARGGSSKAPNLQYLCVAHNRRKSDNREVTESWLNLL